VKIELRYENQSRTAKYTSGNCSMVGLEAETAEWRHEFFPTWEQAPGQSTIPLPDLEPSRGAMNSSID
jgi:hypothetical protein